MAYSSTTAIFLLLPDLSKSSTVWSMIERHVARADALIDSKIGRRYSVPISPTPPMLGLLSEDITTFFVYRSLYRQDNTNRNDYLDNFNDALSELNEIRDGKIDLIDTTGSPIEERSSESTTGVLDSTTRDYQPFFDVDDELSWKFDDNFLDDVADKR